MYPIVRKVEFDATVTAVKSWVEIVREHEERKQRLRARTRRSRDPTQCVDLRAQIVTTGCELEWPQTALRAFPREQRLADESAATVASAHSA